MTPRERVLRVWPTATCERACNMPSIYVVEANIAGTNVLISADGSSRSAWCRAAAVADETMARCSQVSDEMAATEAAGK